MPLIVTPFYAALATLFYLFLSKRVIDRRLKHKKALGSVEGDLEQAIRAHANFSEYVPLAFLMIAFIELQSWRIELVHALAITLLICRILHWWGLSKSSGTSKQRFLGALGTFLVLLVSSGATIYTFMKSF